MAYATVAQKKHKGDRTTGTVPGKRTTVDVPTELLNRAEAQIAKFRPGYGPRVTFRQLVLEGLELRLAQLEQSK
jgi:hypothetical protein